MLITGASSGIGAALAREYSHQGYQVALLARRLDRLEALQQELAAGALSLQADVTVEGSLEGAVAQVMSHWGRIDVAIANAGFGVVGHVRRLALADYRRQFETNVFGVLRTVQAVLPALEKSQGKLALVGSVNGYVALAGNSPYAMSKFAVRALADSLRLELASMGISVTHIAPGFIESEIRRIDNQGRLREGAPDPIPRWLIAPAAQAARQMVWAIERRRPEVVVTGHGKVAVGMARLCPGLLQMLLRLFKVDARPEPVSHSVPPTPPG